MPEGLWKQPKQRARSTGRRPRRPHPTWTASRGTTAMGSKGKVSEAFFPTRDRTHDGNKSPYAVKPSHMKKVMARWRPDFQGYAQHDAHEFLVPTRRPFPTFNAVS